MSELTETLRRGAEVFRANAERFSRLHSPPKGAELRDRGLDAQAKFAEAVVALSEKIDHLVPERTR